MVERLDLSQEVLYVNFVSKGYFHIWEGSVEEVDKISSIFVVISGLITKSHRQIYSWLASYVPNIKSPIKYSDCSVDK